MMMPNSDRIHVRLETDEHLLSGWLRHNIRLGFSHLPFDRCLKYWGLPKQQLKAQRVNGFVIETILAQVSPASRAQVMLLNRHTIRPLWLLGADEIELRKEEQEWLLSNHEKNMFAFRQSWQLCPCCVMEDKAAHGFSYWHRVHQLPSIAHCLRHDEPLLSHSDLDHLKQLVLPEKHLKGLALDAAAVHEDIIQWSCFVEAVDELIRQEPSLPTRWRQITHTLMDLPTPTQQKHRAFYKDLVQQLERDVGTPLMAYLFLAWREQRKVRPNMLWLTLSDIKTQQGIQHPVLWLIVFYWLRKHLPGLKGL